MRYLFAEGVKNYEDNMEPLKCDGDGSCVQGKRSIIYGVTLDPQLV